MSFGKLDYKTFFVEAAQGAHHFDFRSIKRMMSVMDLLERKFVSSMMIRCGIASPPIFWKAGVDLVTIKTLLGHNSLQSTQRYLQIRQPKLGSTVSPLDLLDLRDPRFRSGTIMLLARPGLVAGERSGRPELADIFRSHGQSYQRTHRAVGLCSTK